MGIGVTKVHYGGSKRVLNQRGGGLETGYNLVMAFATVAIRMLVVMVLLGIAGSAVVALISFLEDGKKLFGKD